MTRKHITHLWPQYIVKIHSAYIVKIYIAIFNIALMFEKEENKDMGS